MEGGKKWFEFGDEKIQGKYEGEIVNGVPNGWGKVVFPSGSVYEGSWKDGDTEGIGTYKWLDGTKYFGEFLDGNFHGEGEFTFREGVYLGESKFGKQWERNIHL